MNGQDLDKNWLDSAERASRDEIMSLQRERLARTLWHVYEHVPHYRRAFDGRGVHPADFRQLPDLAKFPFTVKADLRDNYPFGMFAVPVGQGGASARVVGNDGQTGRGRLHQGRCRHVGGRGRPLFRAAAPGPE